MILLTAGETYDRMFGLDWQLLADSVLTLVAVFALFLVMSYFLFNPARKMLNDRKQRIQGELEEARNNLEKANHLKAEYERKLKDVEKEAEGILSDARKKALDSENRIIAGARQEAVRIMERAHTEAALEKQKMADQVKKEIISVASLMAEKVIAVSIDTAVTMDINVQEQLLDETLKEIGESTWLS